MTSRKGSKSCSPKMTRRDVLRLGAGLASVAAVGPFVLRIAGAGESFNWQRFRGSKIYVLFTKHPWNDTVQRMLPEFEKLTGIKVDFTDLPEIQARQKATVEFTAGSGGVDAWYTSLLIEKRRFWKSGWYLDLSKFLSDPTMTSPDYDWNDMAAGARESVVQSDGTISGLPAFVDPWIFFYRKDLFAQQGLRPPRTLAEMEEFAQKFHNAPNLYGFVARGLKNANAPAWDWVLFSMGGNVLTKDGKASINTPEAVKAMDWYASMLRRFAPPGVVNFNWYECSSAFMQGQVAMYFDGVNFAGQFEDKEKSKIAGKVGYAVLPAGPGGHYPVMFTSAMAVSAQSKNPGPAYFLAQWATSKQNAIQELLAGVGTARTAVWNNPEVKAKAKMPADWWQAYVDSMKIGRLGLPEIVGVTEYRDIIGVAIQKAIEGAKSADVLAQAQKEFQEVLDKTEK
jgi:multiple sugar transport system substrate-binding protein